MDGKEKNFPLLGNTIDLDQIDESALDWHDRLGLCYARLMSWKWDDILGPKPENFDALPTGATRPIGSKERPVCKSDYISVPLITIRSILGEMEASRFWWTFRRGVSNEDWLRYAIQSRQIMEDHYGRKA